MKELTFMVTRSCNWRCAYCSIRQDRPVEPNAEGMLKAFRGLLAGYKKEDYLVVNLSGGEPGLLSKELMIGMLEAIVANSVPTQLNIFTNGKAFWVHKLLTKNQKRYASVIQDYKFIWHCTSSIRSLKKLRLPSYLKRCTLPVAVVTEADIDHLEAFLVKNQKLKPFLALHNHCYEQDKLGVRSLDRVVAILERHYNSFALRSLEIPSFIVKPGNPELSMHRKFCSENLASNHHVYDISLGVPVRYHCCVDVSSGVNPVDCSRCTNYQQFYENALNTYGYTQPLITTNC